MSFLIRVMLCCSLAASAARAQEGAPAHGLDPSKVALPQKQGTLLNINGSISVSGSSGAMALSLPLPLPDWRSFAPKFQLGYNSNEGLTPYGYGWDLGLPVFKRSLRLGVPQADHGIYSSLFDGEIVPYQGDMLRSRLEGDSPRLYRFRDKSVEMEDGNGNRYLFGADAESRVDRGNLTLEWHLSRVIDPFGNTVQYHYQRKGNILYPDHIDFLEANGQLSFSLQFSFAPVGNFVWINHRSGIERRLDQFLSRIEIYSHLNGQKQRVSRLSPVYEAAQGNGRPMLTGIERFGVADADVIPRWTMVYSGAYGGQVGAIKAFAFEGPTGPDIGGNGHRILDLNRDGRPDILSQVTAAIDSWTMWTNPGPDAAIMPKQAFSLQNFNLNSGWHTIADFNGDRVPDIFLNESGVNLQVMLSGPNGYQMQTIQGLESVFLGGGPSTYDLVDLNGDSLVDLIAYFGASYAVFTNISKGADVRFKKEDATFPLPFPFQQSRQWVDLNGDGVPDLVNAQADTTVDGSPAALAFSIQNGLGAVAEQVEFIGVFGNCCRPGKTSFFDFNGDGLIDILQNDGSTLELLVQSINAQGKREFRTWQSITSLLGPPGNIPIDTVNQVVGGDADGDGVEDLIFTSSLHNQLFYMPIQVESRQPRPHLLESFDNGVGDIASYAYKSSRKNIDLPISYVTANETRLQGLMPTLSGKKKGLKRRSWHEFAEGRYDYERNEFMGFLQHQLIEYADDAAQNGQRVVEVYYGKGQPVLQGLLQKKSVYSFTTGPREFLHSEVEFDYRAEAIQPGLWLRYLKKKKETRFEPGENPKTLETQYCQEWDPQTKVIVSRLEKRLNAGKVDRINETVYRRSDASNWRSAQVSLQAIYVAAGTEFKRVSGQYFHYLNGTVDQIHVWDDRTEKPQWTLQVGVVRNQAGDVETYADGGGRQLKIFYKAEAPFLLDHTEETVSGHGRTQVLTNSYEWDYAKGGKVASSKDADDHQTFYRWDGLGRIQGIKGPDSPEDDFTFAYIWGNADNYGRIETRNRATDVPIDIQFTDGDLQVIASLKSGKTGYVLSGYAEKDQRGRAIAEVSGMPLTGDSIDMLSNAASYAFLQTFDHRDRPLTRTAPWAKAGQSIRFTYKRDMQIERNHEGEVSARVLDELDRVCRISQYRNAQAADFVPDAGCALDRAPSAVNEYAIAVAYDGADHIQGLSINGRNKRTYQYLSNNQIRSIETQGLGLYSYEYDAMGRRVASFHRGADGGPVAATLQRFDGMGREVERRSRQAFAGSYATDWDQATTEFRFFYDEPVVQDDELTNTRGRLASLEVFKGARYDYGYSPRGQVTLESLKLYQSEWRTRYEHDEYDRLKQVTLPDQVTLAYAYESRRHMLTTGGVFDGQNFAVDYDEMQELKEIQLGDFKHAYRFNPVRRIMEAATASMGEQRIMDLVYGDLDAEQRPHSISGWPKLGAKTDFTYDGLGQLKTSTGAVAQSYAYTPDLLLLGKDARAASVNALPQGFEFKHADGSFLFDGSGRASQTPDFQKLEWDGKDDLTCLVKQGAERSAYSYLPSGEVFGAEIASGETKESRVYINRYLEYERFSKTFRHYLFIGSDRVAASETGGRKFFYAKDGLGSSRVIHDGTRAEEIDADVWGQVGKTVAPEFVGFAGGRQRDNLVQFGKRYYSPRSGWFLSRDMHVLENPQSCIESPIDCNLFAYGRNNPLRFTDPTGMLSFETFTPQERALIRGNEAAFNRGQMYGFGMGAALGVGVVATVFGGEVLALVSPKIAEMILATTVRVTVISPIGYKLTDLSTKVTYMLADLPIANNAKYAQMAATYALAQGQTKGAAAELWVGGRVFTAVSGEIVEHSREVTGVLMSTPLKRQAEWHGGCAEVGCFDKAINAAYSLTGGKVTAVNIGNSGKGHGTLKVICPSCVEMSEWFKVTEGK